MTLVYDLEQLANFHSFTGLDIKTGNVYTFVIHPSLNQLDDYYNFIQRQVTRLIGYNNLSFDYPLLHYILLSYNRWKIQKYTTVKIVEELYAEAQSIINTKYSEISAHKVLIPQVDLYRIHHFDNDAKRTSLKHLEFVLRFESVQDMPLKHYNLVDASQIKMILDYNLNDVLATYRFLKQEETIKAIKLRKDLGEQFGLDFTNHNDPKIASDIFLQQLSKHLKISPHILSAKRTYRSVIELSNCINPADYPFKKECFKDLMSFFCSQKITQTKGFFKALPLKSVGKLVKHQLSSNIDKKKAQLKKLSLYYNGIQIDYGLGGLHASQPPGIYSSDEEHVIIDVDVSSFYPNIAIKKRAFPAHLSEYFCDIYENIYNQRKVIPKINPMNLAYKLMLNGTYGKSNDQYSFFYDPQYTMTVTLNGQLSLSYLAEMVCENINCDIIQMNTDGITFKIKRTDKDTFKNICSSWEMFTNYELEYVNYDRMIIRDVNNYIAIYEDTTKKPKLKGTFLVKPEFHKDHSMLAVAKALLEYYWKGIPFEESLRANKDVFDFYIQKRAKGDWTLKNIKLTKKGVSTKDLSKNVRFLVTNKGHALAKVHVYDNRKSAVCKGYKTTVYNLHVEKKFDDYDINYQYYVNECKKITDLIEPRRNQLSIF